MSGKKITSGLPELSLRRNSVKRKLERLGVIDVGSNSVRLVIFDGAARSPAYFFNEKIMCGLGSGVAQTGLLNPVGRARAVIALKRFVLLAKGMQSWPLFAVATAAVREAGDGPDFCAEITRETGLVLNVASGEEEARLSAQGVLLGWPDAKGLMCDIGGSSMELAEISGGKVGRCVTSPLGPLKLAQFETEAELREEITSRVSHLRKIMSRNYNTLFLVGGSWRAIARLDMERRDYPLKVLHEYAMPPVEVLKTVAWIDGKSVTEMRGLTGSSPARLELVPVASQVLSELVAQFAPDKIAASSYGIREGLLYEQMPKSLRKRDPLIEACIHMERASARNPGFGKVLFDFLRPVFSDAGPARKRLIRAACLLHDVTWRAHPDYRAEVCFDNATRSNLGGLDHAGRVFLGMALLHRYKNNSSENSFEAMIALLGPQERRDAAILGKAMRFGAMLSGASVQLMGQLKLHRQAGLLELLLPRPSKDLFGEVVATRFESLARSLDCTTKVSVV